MLLLARSRLSKKKIHLCGFIHSNQMLICSGFYRNSSQSYNHEESLGNESLGVCFAFCIRKGKIHNFNFLLSIPTSKHPLAPSALYQDWRRWNSDVDNSYFPPETCTTTIMCAWLSRSARELSHVHSRQKGPRTGNRRTRKTILVAMESMATKIVPGRVCPRTRQQLHARACGFFSWEDGKHGAEKSHAEVRWSRGKWKRKRLSELLSLSLSFPVLEFDPTITFQKRGVKWRRRSHCTLCTTRTPPSWIRRFTLCQSKDRSFWRGNLKKSRTSVSFRLRQRA